jgi:phenylacetate-CoA ligase
LERLDRAALDRWQLQRLNQLLAATLPHNRFYAGKLASVLPPRRTPDGGLQLAALDELAALPFTFKAELVDGLQQSHQPVNLTRPLPEYLRFHQTSGTHGRPLVVLDTRSDWQWWLDCWQFVLDAAGIQPGDCLLMAFSFGPFIGFWSAFEAAVHRGCRVVPGGGMSTLSRLEALRVSRATAIFCTPSYALHLAEAAAEHHTDPRTLGIRQIVVAGEPGGSIPSVRSRIEHVWNAQVLDHSGATEVGPWGYGDSAGLGLHVLETEFIAEFLSVESGAAAADGELSELVLTSLGRTGCPVIRYRTGDLVRPRRRHELLRQFVFLDGGVLGRSDDMLVVRGVNVYPSAVEQILRGFPEIVEFRLVARRLAQMDHLLVQIEDRLHEPQRVADELRLRLGLKVEVECVPALSLPRFEGKGRRFVDERRGLREDHAT